mgnify:FL=1
MVAAAALLLFRKIVNRDTVPGAITGGANCLLTDGGVDTSRRARVGSSFTTPSVVVTPPPAIVFV